MMVVLILLEKNFLNSQKCLDECSVLAWKENTLNNLCNFCAMLLFFQGYFCTNKFHNYYTFIHLLTYFVIRTRPLYPDHQNSNPVIVKCSDNIKLILIYNRVLGEKADILYRPLLVNEAHFTHYEFFLYKINFVILPISSSENCNRFHKILQTFLCNVVIYKIWL